MWSWPSTARPQCGGTGSIFRIIPVYLLMIISLITLYRGFRIAPTYTERNRLLLLVMAGAVAIGGGLLDVAPAVGIDVPPATSWTNSLFFVLVGTAILRFHLFDIQVTVQRRAAYVYRSVFTIAVFCAVVFPMAALNAPIWAVVVASAGLIVSVEPIWRWMDGWLRRSLERDLGQQIPELLNIALTSMQGKEHTSQVAEAIVQSVGKVINPQHTVLLEVRGNSNQVLLATGYGDGDMPVPSPTHPLVRWFRNRREPVFHIDLIVEPEFQTMTFQERRFSTGLPHRYTHRWFPGTH